MFRDKQMLSSQAARGLTRTIHAKFRAWNPATITFPKEGRVVDTRNTWLLGWSPEHQAWCASNGSKAWKFRDFGALRSFREALASWDWEVEPVAS